MLLKDSCFIFNFFTVDNILGFRLTQLKDLKRQLHAERKRAERLQERLQELLTTTQSKQSKDQKIKSKFILPSIDRNNLFYKLMWLNLMWITSSADS